MPVFDGQVDRIPEIGLLPFLRTVLAIASAHQGDLRECLPDVPDGKRAFFYGEWERGDNTWTRVAVPATEYPRIGRAFLEEERQALGPAWFTQEYLSCTGVPSRVRRVSPILRHPVGES